MWDTIACDAVAGNGAAVDDSVGEVVTYAIGDGSIEAIENPEVNSSPVLILMCMW